MAAAGGVLGTVLAGGRSRRMGRDKAAIELDGRTLLERAVDALAEVADEVVVVGLPPGRAAPPLPPRASRRVSDAVGDAGALAGLATAVATGADADADVVLVAADDHPWLIPEVLALLVDELRTGGGQASLLMSSRGPQPLPGAYRSVAAAALARLLEVGERRLLAITEHLDVRTVPSPRWRPLDPWGTSIVDVDTPAELEGAVSWWSRARATAASPSPPGTDAPLVRVRQVTPDGVRPFDDRVIGEEPLEIRVAGPGQDPEPVMTTMRTPGHEREQAVGWLVTEGLVAPDTVVGAGPGDAVALARPDDTVTVELSVPFDASPLDRRHAVATASCGVCGRASIDELAARVEPVLDDPLLQVPVAWERLASLPDELRAAQARFHATGGVHATGLFDPEGRLVTLREDVGRHNALDAAIGAHVLGGVWPARGLEDLVCVLSGRIGFELVAKAAAARLPVVLGVGAASDLAVRTAERLGITLVGFLRDGGGTLYTDPGRLLLGASAGS